MKNLKEVCIIGTARAPTGAYGGIFKGLSAVDLGVQTFRGMLEKYPIDPALIESAYLGLYYLYGMGPSPMKQITEQLSLPPTMNCSYVTKVCASGMKAVFVGIMEILSEQSELVLVGGIESFTNEYLYLTKEQAKQRTKEVFYCKIEQKMLGEIADDWAGKEGFSREEQDDYTLRSYERAEAAREQGLMQGDIITVNYNGELHYRDELKDMRRGLRTVRPAFRKTGTVTTLNLGPFGDGASLMLLSTRDRAKELGLPVLATVVGFAEAEVSPADFVGAHIPAMEKNLAKANLTLADIELFEICETFALCPLQSIRKQRISEDIINVYGGDLVYGHTIGPTGTRMLITLLTAMRNQNKQLGLAAMPGACGGGNSIIIKVEE